jgi:hypothetical protein
VRSDAREDGVVRSGGFRRESSGGAERGAGSRDRRHCHSDGRRYNDWRRQIRWHRTDAPEQASAAGRRAQQAKNNGDKLLIRLLLLLLLLLLDRQFAIDRKSQVFRAAFCYWCTPSTVCNFDQQLQANSITVF